MTIDPKIRTLRDQYGFNFIFMRGADTPSRNARELIGHMMDGAAHLNQHAQAVNGCGFPGAMVAATHRILGREMTVTARFAFTAEPDDPQKFSVGLPASEQERLKDLDRAMKWVLN